MILLDDILSEFHYRLDPAKRIQCFGKDTGFEFLTNVPRLVCTDGYTVSMQASAYVHCAPQDNIGPWVAVELGFSSAADYTIAKYAEDSSNLTDTVYNMVPLIVVALLIQKHDGLEPVPIL